jgi:glucan biosynthesis protein
MQILFTPERLIAELERSMFDDQNESVTTQIAYVEGEIAKIETEDAKLYRAYMADVFDENEYAERRKALKDRQSRLNAELHSLQPREYTREQFEADKAYFQALGTRFQAGVDLYRFSFEEKRQILKQCVDEIRLNTAAGTLTIAGSLIQSSEVSIPTRRVMPSVGSTQPGSKPTLPASCGATRPTNWMPA